MMNTIEAVYEQGVFKPLKNPRLPNGQLVQIIIKTLSYPPPNKLAKLTPHPDCIIGDPEDLVHIDWISEWKNDLS
jgi:predicted DNA-binding antitoxin AbrB/MazE fold protein